MIVTAHLDESGTHTQSAISVMAGYVATSAQWERFGAYWTALLRKAGVQHIHAVELFKRTKQFKGWRAEDVNTLAIALDGVIARHLQLGFSVIIRDDDYKNIYGARPNPKRLPKDTKYGVCFRACLAFVPSFIASELKRAAQTSPAHQITIDFALEQGHRNAGDAQRLFALFKADALPEWRHLVGAMDLSTKDSPGAQAADFLAYCIYRAESLEHGDAPSIIEKSSYVADTSVIANTYPRHSVPQYGPMLFRIPVSRQVLQSLKDDLFAIEAERRTRPRP